MRLFITKQLAFVGCSTFHSSRPPFLPPPPPPFTGAASFSPPLRRQNRYFSSDSSLAPPVLAMSSRGRRGEGQPRRPRPTTGNGRRGGQQNRRRRSRTPPPPMPDPGQPGRECHRSAITAGMDVYVVKKEDQRTDKETKGTVSRLLTNSSYHPRGIKVMLTSGEVGRVVRFVVVVGGQPRAETEVQLLPSSVSPALVSGTDG
uniref:Uncharacterized protein n=1 Tax=Ditylum brightwellii TaxID=49249 RepID=A0A7S1Z0R7_9STRA|mmetsp:Transcript_21735/g.32325  ORF Transcript_21735/g.32325 Transcript_21735/m.32325 type:complete len:202 (+) Transcript_21735:83-688(+)